MIIDSHEHLILPIEMQINKLEEAGVDKAILFTTTPHPEKANTMQEFKNEMSVLFKVLSGEKNHKNDMKRMENNINDLMKVLKKYSDKFYGFGPLPLGLNLDETVSWIEKYIVSNNLKGVGEFTPGNDEQVKQLEIIFQALENYSYLPIWIHTFYPVTLNGINILMELTKKYSKVSVIVKVSGIIPISSNKYLPSINFIVLFCTSFLCFSGSSTFIKMIGPILNFEKCVSIASHKV